MKNVSTHDLRIHKRNLPHWQMDGSVYYVTFKLNSGELSCEAKAIVREVLLNKHNDRYKLHIAAIMQDHVHAILQPLEMSNGNWWSISNIMKSVKGVSAREINKLNSNTGSIWQPESFDRIIRDEDEYLEKWKYVMENPLKAGLCNNIDEYEFIVLPEDQ